MQVVKNGMLLAVCGLLLSADALRADDVEMSAAEKKFAEQMTNVVLEGTFTVTGKKDQSPKPERYEIESARKIGNDVWTITARVKYGKHDVKVPIPVKVLWAGDTPMISLTDLSIPGLGTFTSRVLFYEDRYAGTWQHGKVGGHLFGTLKKAAAKPTE